MNRRLERLRRAVQANCDVSDARHARNMTLCTYLLEMRELFRWERGAALTAPLPRADVGPLGLGVGERVSLPVQRPPEHVCKT